MVVLVVMAVMLEMKTVINSFSEDWCVHNSHGQDLNVVFLNES